MNRRSLLKTVGVSGIALSSLPSITAAESSFNVETQKLDAKEVNDVFDQAEQTRPVTEMRDFLIENANVTIKSSDFSGVRVVPRQAPKHVVLQATITRGQANDESVDVALRVFENTATASVLVGDSGYKANPETIKQGVSTDTNNESVVSIDSWVSHFAEHDDLELLSENCDSQGTFDVGGPACDFLAGVALLSGTIMAFLPEPGSTIAGTTLVSGVTGGNCQIADSLDQILDDSCNYSKITVCVNYNCRLDPLTGTWCEPAIKVWPDC